MLRSLLGRLGIKDIAIRIKVQAFYWLIGHISNYWLYIIVMCDSVKKVY